MRPLTRRATAHKGVTTGLRQLDSLLGMSIDPYSPHGRLRYGPHTTWVEEFLETASQLDDDDWTTVRRVAVKKKNLNAFTEAMSTLMLYPEQSYFWQRSQRAAAAVTRKAGWHIEFPGLSAGRCAGAIAVADCLSWEQFAAISKPIGKTNKIDLERLYWGAAQQTIPEYPLEDWAPAPWWWRQELPNHW